MVEADEDLRFPLKPGEPVWICREGVGQDLQGDLAVELRVGDLPDLAHAPLAQERGDVVVPEAGAGTQRHGLLGPMIAPFYAQAVDGSTVRHRSAPKKRTYAWSEGLSCRTGLRGG